MSLVMSHPVFPTPDVARTAEYYRRVLGFEVVEYLDATEPHACLYREGAEVILTRTDRTVRPVRELYGYGYDVYLISADQRALHDAWVAGGATVVRPLTRTDYHNTEFVVEDCDGRWLGVGIKD